MISIPGYKLNGVIYDNPVTIIYNGIRVSDNLPVIVKTHNVDYPDPLTIASYRRELQISNLIDSDKVLKYYEIQKYGNGLCLIMEDFGGVTISEFINHKKIEINEFLEIALKIVESLEIIHKSGIIHKDIKPQNILINKQTGIVKIIDFSISSVLSQEKSNFQSVKQLEGTLEYISPEQTGRINRNVDHRSDLYSLGITFYQMLTGTLPFNNSDSIELIHSHIAKNPPNPISVREDIPEVVAEMVLKLLSKSVEERYKSIYGLKNDIKKLLNEYKISNGFLNFKIAENDYSDKFIIPQKLYGREKEIESLYNSFKKICDPKLNSKRELIFISGVSGIGKSAFVNEIKKPVSEKNAYFLISKFDQNKQNIPLYSIVNTFKTLINQILLEDNLEKWKKLILNEIGNNGQILINVIPELELIIGEQIPVEELPPSESQNRFNSTMISFIKVFSNESHPLVIFFDDLQWADLSTLKLIETILQEEGLKFLLLIGCYRSNEVDLAHPLLRTIESIRSTDVEIHELILDALKMEDVSQLISDILNSNRNKVLSLTKALYSKTMGNPFFVSQYLSSLYEEKLIYFDFDTASWCWDESQILHKDISNNVIDLVIKKLSKLDSQTIDILKLASCIGNQFSLADIEFVIGKSKYTIANFLWSAIQEGHIIPLDDSYKFILDEESKNINVRYKFVHDRIQHAIYSLLAEGLKKEFHLNIGRMFLEKKKEDDSLYTIVNHLNIGKDLITDNSELTTLKELNFQAGKKAKQSNAYEESVGFFQIAFMLLTKDSFHQNYSFTVSLYTEYSTCLYLIGKFEEAEKIFSTLESNLKNREDKLDFLFNKLLVYYTMGKINLALNAGIEGLSFFNTRISKKAGLLPLLLEIAKIKFKTYKKDIKDLNALPINSDIDRVLGDRFITTLIQPAYLSGNELLHVLLECKIVNLSISSGITEYSALSFASFGVALCAALGDANTGYEYGQLALKICEKFEHKEYKPKVFFLFSCLITPWKKHLKETITPAREAYELSIEMGDWLYAAYSGIRLVNQKLSKGDPLSEVELEARKYLSFIERTKMQNLVDNINLWLHISLNLQGLTESKFSWNTNEFDEEAAMSRMKSSGYAVGICLFYLYKAQMYFFYEDYSTAYMMILEAESGKKSLMGLTDYAEVPFYYSLILSNLDPSKHNLKKRTIVRQLNKNKKQLKTWTDNCPENFFHKYLLVSAEIEKIQGNTLQAMKYYNEAILLAAENDFTQHVAIANDLASKFYTQLGFDEIAKTHSFQAHYNFKKWGANSITKSIEEKYKNINVQKPQKGSHTTSYTNRATSIISGTSLNTNANLDLESVLKASNLISSEFLLEKLLEKLMKITIENAGAQRGYLLLVNKQELSVAIEWSSEKGAIQNNADQSNFPIANSIVQYIKNKREFVSVDYAVKDERFKNDPYIIKNKPKSILGIPLLNQGKLIGVLYLENNLIEYAFTEDRIEVLKLLSSQAAISIENAKLFSNISSLNAVYEKFVPKQFLELLGKEEITSVTLGDHVQKDMTIFFSDIRSFTSLSEKMTPQENFQFLNSYLKTVGPVIRKHNGFIDKYIGDAIMALYPTNVEDGIDTAIEIQTELRQFNKYRMKSGYDPISVGIGLHFGSLILGTIGENERMEGTVISDSVNLASRVEGLTKKYGSSILVTDKLFNKIKNPENYFYRVLDQVRVKGKSEPVQIIEILNGQPEFKIDLYMNSKQIFEMAVNSYLQREFEASIELFGNVLDQNKGDTAAKIYLKRAKFYNENGVPEDWEGIEDMDSK